MGNICLFTCLIQGCTSCGTHGHRDQLDSLTITNITHWKSTAWKSCCFNAGDLCIISLLPQLYINWVPYCSLTHHPSSKLFLLFMIRLTILALWVHAQHRAPLLVSVYFVQYIGVVHYKINHHRFSVRWSRNSHIGRTIMIVHHNRMDFI